MTGDSTGIDRIDGMNSAVAVKAPCVAATTTPITLSGIQTIDGVLLQAGGPSSTGTATADRVLVMGQADTTTNGIYLVQTGAWIQAYDFDGPRDAVQGTLIFVRSGTSYGGTWWRVTTTDNPIEFGVSHLTFAQVNLGGPGGTTGQLQFNNSGSFGGVTLSGDVTISSSGLMSISSGAISSSKMANMAANSVKGNASSAAGVPSDVALTANTLLGMGSSGNLAAISLSSGLSMAGSTLSGTAASSTLLGICRPDNSTITVSSGIMSASASTLLTPAATTSGSSATFTIPSTAKKITVNFQAFATSSTSMPIIQIGPSSGVETSGYVGATTLSNSAGNTGTAWAGSGIALGGLWGSTYVAAGSITLSLLDSTNNIWAVYGGTTGVPGTAGTQVAAGQKPLAAAIGKLTLTTTNGTNTFSGGSVNVMYQ